MMHSNQRSTCELIEKMSTATVFLTSHGFQSILLLFQPLISSFIEIHPYLYYKPGFYGDINASFRNNFQLPRAYLSEESVPDNASFVGRIVYFLHSRNWLDEYICVSGTARALCRNMYRIQSVTMSSQLIQRTIAMIQTYFVLQ